MRVWRRRLPDLGVNILPTRTATLFNLDTPHASPWLRVWQRRLLPYTYKPPINKSTKKYLKNKTHFFQEQSRKISLITRVQISKHQLLHHTTLGTLHSAFLGAAPSGFTSTSHKSECCQLPDQQPGCF